MPDLIVLLWTVHSLVAAGERRVGFLRKRFESIMKDKSSKLQLLSSTEQFRKRIDKLLSWFLGMLHCPSVLIVFKCRALDFLLRLSVVFI